MAFVPLARYPSTPQTQERWYTSLVALVNGLLTNTQRGEGDPEGVVTAPQGTIWQRTDGAAGTTLYAKTDGGTDPATLTNTGWASFA